MGFELATISFYALTNFDSLPAVVGNLLPRLRQPHLRRVFIQYFRFRKPRSGSGRTSQPKQPAAAVGVGPAAEEVRWERGHLSRPFHLLCSEWCNLMFTSVQFFLQQLKIIVAAEDSTSSVIEKKKTVDFILITEVDNLTKSATRIEPAPWSIRANRCATIPYLKCPMKYEPKEYLKSSPNRKIDCSILGFNLTQFLFHQKWGLPSWVALIFDEA